MTKKTFTGKGGEIKEWEESPEATEAIYRRCLHDDSSVDLSKLDRRYKSILLIRRLEND